jgi:hypothetical protein
VLESQEWGFRKTWFNKALLQKRIFPNVSARDAAVKNTVAVANAQQKPQHREQYTALLVHPRTLKGRNELVNPCSQARYYTPSSGRLCPLI